MDESYLWGAPAVFVLLAVQALAVERGRLTAAAAGALGVLGIAIIVRNLVDGGRPPVELAYVVLIAIVLLAGVGIGLRTLGGDVLVDRRRSRRGVWAAALARGRVDRAVRHPSGEAATVAPGLSGTLAAAAREAGAADPVAAVLRIDSELGAHQRHRMSPDARIGLLLYHRTVYAALAAVLGRSPTDPVRWRNDLDLARTLLPDIRLGWLADAAVALAEGRPAAAAAGAYAVRQGPRGQWERGLATVIGSQAHDRPAPSLEEGAARAAARTPWVSGLAARLADVRTASGSPA